MIEDRTLVYLVGTVMLVALVGWFARTASPRGLRYLYIGGLAGVVASILGAMLIGGLTGSGVPGLLTFSPNIPPSAYPFHRIAAVSYALLFGGLIGALLRQLSKRAGVSKRS